MTKKNELSMEIKADLNMASSDAGCERVVEVAVTAPVEEKLDVRPPLNLALVIDRSGSMGGQKIEYTRQAALQILDSLKEKDRVAIVVYDNEILVLSPAVEASKENLAALRRQVKALEARGSTDLGGGWLRGCECIAEEMPEGALTRALLISDGLANVGITDLEELGMHARALLQRDVVTSTFGVGLDFNEQLLEHMANMGGGRFSFIESPLMIPEILLREFGELSTVTAKKVEIELSLPRGTKVYVPGGWSRQDSGDRVRLQVGDLTSGQRREVYLQFLLDPQTGKEVILPVIARAGSVSGDVMEAQGSLALRCAPQVEVQSAPVDDGLMKRFAEVMVADAGSEAIKLERQGKREEAAALLEQVLEKFRRWLPEKLAREYEGTKLHMKMGRDEYSIKSSHAVWYDTKQRRRKD